MRFRTAGEAYQGCSVSGGGQGTGHNGLWTVPRGGHGARHGPRVLTCGESNAHPRLHEVGVTQRKLQSARGDILVRPHRYAVRPTSR